MRMVKARKCNPAKDSGALSFRHSLRCATATGWLLKWHDRCQVKAGSGEPQLGPCDLEEARAEDPSIAFLYTDCSLIAQDGSELDRGKSAAFDPALLERFSFVPEPALCLAAPVLEAAPYDETIRKGTKHHKWKKIVANGWMGKHLAEPLFCYRMHEGNLSGIGKRVIGEVESGIGGERILSGYWPLQTTER